MTGPQDRRPGSRPEPQPDAPERPVELPELPFERTAPLPGWVRPVLLAVGLALGLLVGYGLLGGRLFGR